MKNVQCWRNSPTRRQVPSCRLMTINSAAELLRWRANWQKSRSSPPSAPSLRCLPAPRRLRDNCNHAVSVCVDGRDCTRSAAREKRQTFFPSLLCFFDFENETENCSQMHPSAQAPVLKKSDSKNNPCE